MVMTDKDLALIQRAKSGDASAYNELYQNYYQFVFYYAWTLSKNEADAKDITQEVFLQVYKSLPDLRDIALFVPWLRKITHSKTQVMFRSKKDAIYDSEQISKELGKEKRKEFVPHEYLDFMSDKEILEHLMYQLSDKRRTVLEMFYFEQLSMEEIAQRMDISVSTVKGRLHEARKALYKMVNAFELEEGRKITFHLEPISSIGALGCLYGIQAWFASFDLAKVVQAAMVVVSVVAGGMAMKETHDVYQMKHMAPKPVEISSEQENLIAFQPVIYHNKVITNTNDAYFVIMDFAADKECLKDKKQQELMEIQPLVEELCSSDNAYKDELISTGWLEVFQSML